LSASGTPGVGQYVRALGTGDTHDLQTAWPGTVVVHDPRAGEVRGNKQLRQFVRRSEDLLAEPQARIETIAATRAGGRAVVELLAHLSSDGRPIA
jgi:SnoaL-like domain